MLPRLSWGSEIFSVFFSGLSLLAIVVLLAQYDDKPVFSWHGVNLNAIVSILATALKGLLLLAVDEAVGQWKWILFSRQRRVLKDFDVVDAASRGPLGSLKLLWRLEGAWQIRLGALVILLSLLTDPFSQQLVQLRQSMNYTDDATATIARATRYSRGNEFTTFGEIGNTNMLAFADADFSMQSAILYGMSRPMGDIMQQLDYACSSGNCTWTSPIDSLAVCHRCADLGPVLEKHEDGGALWVSLMRDAGAAKEVVGSRAYRLPNGLIIDNLNTWTFPGYTDGGDDPGTMMTAFGTGDPAQTNAMQDIDTLIWSTSVIKVQKTSNASTVWPQLPIRAMECALHYCVNRYSPSVSGGKLHESTETLSSVRDAASWHFQPAYDNVTYVQDLSPAQVKSLVYNNHTSYLKRSDLRLIADGLYYNISQAAIDSISSYLQDNFASSLQEFNGTTSSDPVLSGRLNGYYMANPQVQYDPSLMQVVWTQNDTEALFAAIARSMSNAIRNGADAIDATVAGSSGALITLYEVQWGWIAMHFAVFLGGLAFVIMTVIHNRLSSSAGPSPIWKNNALASLKFGSQLGDLFGSQQSADEMQKIAARQEVKLLLKPVYAAGDEVNDSLETMMNTHH